MGSGVGSVLGVFQRTSKVPMLVSVISKSDGASLCANVSGASEKIAMAVRHRSAMITGASPQSGSGPLVAQAPQRGFFRPLGF